LNGAWRGKQKKIIITVCRNFKDDGWKKFLIYVQVCDEEQEDHFHIQEKPFVFFSQLKHALRMAVKDYYKLFIPYPGYSSSTGIHESSNGQRGQKQDKVSRSSNPARFFTQLLCCYGADGTLCCTMRNKNEK
jgi:hypothetical protein